MRLFLSVKAWPVPNCLGLTGCAYGNVITNLRPGEEDKLRQDIDLAGTRLDPDGICGQANERCKVQRDEDNNTVLDANGRPQFAYDAYGRIQFTYKPEGQEVSIFDFLDNTDEGKKMYGITGGIQGGTATFAGYAYPAGGVIDQVFKAFGGPHDFIGGQATGLYDQQASVALMKPSEIKETGLTSLDYISFHQGYAC